MRFNISKANFHLFFITDTDINKEEKEGRVRVLLGERCFLLSSSNSQDHVNRDLATHVSSPVCCRLY